MTPQTVKRAALYARISQAVDDTDKVENQLSRLRAAAREAGYAVVHEFTDDDISAYQGKLERPGWTALLAALDAGEIDVVMATEPERLTRGSAVQLDALQVLLVRAGAVLHTLSVGVQDPSSPMVRAFMQIADTIGGLEVAIKTQRQNARNQDELAAGRALWGQRRFGFEDRRTLRESEAEAIREAYKAVRGGATLYSIAKAWNAAGLRTARAGVTVRGREVSGLWSTNTVKNVLTNPSTAGILVHRGVEQEVSNLPAIVSREEWEELCALLGDESRKPTRGPEVKHLLTGLLRCSCGATMTAAVINSRGYRYPIYRCRDAGKPDTGKHSYVRREKADAEVKREVFGWVQEHPEEQPELGGANLGALAVELAELVRRRGVVQQLAQMPGADLSQAATDLRVLGDTITQVQDAMAAERAAAAGTGLIEAVRLDYWQDASLTHAQKLEEQDKALEEFGTWFDALPIEKRRELVRSMFSLVLLPKAEDGHRLDVTYRF